MVENCRTGTDLQQEIKQILQNIHTCVKLPNSIGEVKQGSQVVGDVYGIVRLATAPYYSLTLDTGTAEQPFVLPLTLTDSANHLCQWILVVGRKIWINQLLVVCEQFQVFEEGEGSLQYVSIFVKWDDIRIFESTLITKNITVTPKQDLRTDKSNKIIRKCKAEALFNSSCTCRIMIHHVSTPFYVNQSHAFCLVFISYTGGNHVEVKLWLVLKAEEVAWREFLVPNREYLIQFPSQIDKYYFDKNRKPLKKIFADPTRELCVLFHHREIFSTLDGSLLPVGSKIFLTSNTMFSKLVYKCVKDPFSSWFSASEADSANVDLITFYGQVDSVMYDKEVVFKSCYLCIRAKPKEPTIAEPLFTPANPWMNPWKSEVSMGENELLELPYGMDGNGTMNIGVPGKMVQIIKLRDVVSGIEKSVYIKHTYTLRSQQLFRLTPGMVLCISYLNRRCSNAGRYYFVTTILTSFKVLSYSDNITQGEGWGHYGLNHFTNDSREKVWGVLESFNVTKVSITAKCINCKAVFSRGTCSRNCSSKDFIMSALAMGWLQIIHNKEIISLEKVVIKGDFVRNLLCIPKDVWQLFLKASVEEEIFCFVNDNNMKGFEHFPDLNELFKMYCNIPKAKGKFYVSVRKLSSVSDEENVYYCINLESIDKHRLNIVYGMAKKVFSR